MESTQTEHQNREGKDKKDKKRFSKWQENKDRKNKKQQKKFQFWAENPGEQNKPKNKNGEGEYKQIEYKIGSVKFDEYYQKQFPFLSAEEFKEFTSTLFEKLPVTFRVNQTENHHERVVALFRDPEFIRSHYQVTEEVAGKDVIAVDMNQKFESREGLRNLNLDLSQVKLERKPYYPPGDVLFELTVPREMFKKNLGLKAVHKLVQQSNDAGLLTRQEIVSMLPPLLLDI